jgi:thiol:disulfide interchange protein DsbD
VDAKDEITLNVNSGSKLRAASFFPLDANVIEPSAPQAIRKTAAGLSLVLKKSDEFSGPPRLRGLLVDPAGRAYEIATPGGTVAASSQSEPAALPAASGSAIPSGASDSKGGGVLGQAAGAMLFAFLGGIALNVMPCVFPVLSLKLLAFVTAGREDRRRLRRHGLVYAAGIVVSFWVLVAVLLLLRQGGAMQAGDFNCSLPDLSPFWRRC